MARVGSTLIRRMYAGRSCTWKQDLLLKQGAANVFDIVEQQQGQQSLLACLRNLDSTSSM